MALAQFNDTEVMEFYYTKFGEPDDPLEVQVSTIFNINSFLVNISLNVNVSHFLVTVS